MTSSVHCIILCSVDPSCSVPACTKPALDRHRLPPSRSTEPMTAANESSADFHSSFFTPEASNSKRPRPYPKSIYATNSITPPASLIFFSACLLTYLALTTIGISGNRPFPRTLEYPRGRRSKTGAVSFLEPEVYSSRVSWGRRVQSLSRLMVGFQN